MRPCLDNTRSASRTVPRDALNRLARETSPKADAGGNSPRRDVVARIDRHMFSITWAFTPLGSQVCEEAFFPEIVPIQPFTTESDC